MIARIFAVIGLIFAVAAAWTMLHPPLLPTTRSQRVQDDEWQLPVLSKPDRQALVNSIDQDQLWGANGLPAVLDEKPLTAPNWRITGILSMGPEHYALLAVEGQPIQQLKTGENLPGGAKLLNITADRICIMLNGKKRVLKTYKE